ncbi:unnamed protein product [Eruca vesicaria subsp. sativa]|uniref:KIB1-4 beta-propeller domain-containing protein n=1 Tax=Eruca vesicaria subsp. sativa TaxID=29727 RepID=A0ABC8M100_ERUVS|nr:unnamed protein product [Eruca vesicaria subsp. sativa]
MTDWNAKLILSNEDVKNKDENGSTKDNIRASAVCKARREAAEHVRVVEKYPWIISFPTQGTLFDLFDPLQRKMYSLNLPDIAGMNVCFSKEGCLLMRKSSFVEFFFFNPYSRELISLPNCELPFQAIAFSSAPTSGTCVLVTLNPISEYLVAISICYPGETEWINMEFHVLLLLTPISIATLSMPMVTSTASPREVFYLTLIHLLAL